MKHVEKMVLIGAICAFILGIGYFQYNCVKAESKTKPDYEIKITVDDSQKIPQAISNAVNGIYSKGFMLTKLNISKAAIGNLITVKAGGKDLATILEIE